MHFLPLSLKSTYGEPKNTEIDFILDKECSMQDLRYFLNEYIPLLEQVVEIFLLLLVPLNVFLE